MKEEKYENKDFCWVLHTGTVTFYFGNADRRDEGHIFIARTYTTTIVVVAYFIAPDVSFAAVANNIKSNVGAL